jgi:outer membrane receptor protein involved in Fe transport
MKSTILMLMTLAAGSSLHAEESVTPLVDLDAVLVTAALWASPLEKTAASASVIGNESIQNGNVRHFADLMEQIPNLTATGGSSRPRYFQIRGIGENSQYEGESPDSTVRLLLDDLDFSGLGSPASTFDLRQVEVLRGPQAGAFGAHAAGGVIRLISNEPTPYWSGQLEASLGEDSMREQGLAIGGPLLREGSDTLMFRLAVQHAQSDAFRHNQTLDRATNARDEWLGRLRLTWNPSTQLKLESTLFYGDQNNGYDEFALDNNGRRTYSDQPGRDEQDSKAGSLRLTWSGWERASLSAISSIGIIKSLYSYDDDWTAASYQGFSELHRERENFSQEIRIDSLPDLPVQGMLQPDRWTFGAYAAALDEAAIYENRDPWRTKTLQTDYHSEQLALFGQAAYDLTAHTRLTLGMRTEKLKVDGQGRASDSRPGKAVVDLNSQFDDTLWGGKISLEHELPPNLMLWASATRGYKGGGINHDARISPADGDPLDYQTEVLWNWEAGLRLSALQNRLNSSLSLFLMERRDTQIRDSAGFGGSYRFFTDNARDAQIHGLEVQHQLILAGHWQLQGNLALMESEIDPATLSNGNTMPGASLANTPEWAYSCGLQRQPPQGWVLSLGVHGKAAYLESVNHGEQRSAYHVLHAETGWRGNRWSLLFWVRNLLDERYEKRVFYFGNAEPDYAPQRYVSLADPRQIGATLRWQF